MTIMTTKTRPTGIAGVRSYRENPDGTFEVHPAQGADLIKLARNLGIIEKRQNQFTVGDLLEVLKKSDPTMLIGFRADYGTTTAKRFTLDGEHLVLS